MRAVVKVDFLWSMRPILRCGFLRSNLLVVAYAIKRKEGREVGLEEDGARVEEGGEAS